MLAYSLNMNELNTFYKPLNEPILRPYVRNVFGMTGIGSNSPESGPQKYS